MVGWIIGGIVATSVAFTAVLIFFKGASPQQDVMEEKWNEVQNQMLPEYNFKFFGDCGAPNSLEKKFKPLFVSCNSMIGAIKGQARADVYDFTLCEGREMNAPRIHGLIFQAEKHMLNLNALDFNKHIDMQSKDGDYQVVASPNKNYLYILVVEDRYFPITYESVDWYATSNKETLKNNLAVVYKYMDKFCLVERNVA